MLGNSSANSAENSSGSGMCPERFFLFPVPLPAGAALFRMGEKSNRGCFSVKFKFSPEFCPSEIPSRPTIRIRAPFSGGTSAGEEKRKKR